MGLLADAVLVSLALAAPLTGILVGWDRLGLTRHTWVLAKLVLTIGVATAAVLVLRPALHRAAEQALQVSLAWHGPAHPRWVLPARRRHSGPSDSSR
jgi:hypothetical protein